MTKPNIIYKYYDIQGAELTLRKKCVRVKNFRELNDPFELLPQSAPFINNKQNGVALFSEFIEQAKTNPLYKNIINEIIVDGIENTVDSIIKNPLDIVDIFRYISSTYYICCFSERFDSLLMWSHYANEHAGVCLGFNADHMNIVKVKYSEKRVLFSCDSQQFEVSIYNTCFTKYRDWSYEQEWRILLNRLKVKNIQSQSNLHLYPFDINLVKCAFFGLKTTQDEKKKIMDLLPENVEIYQAKQHKCDYAVEFIRLI